ncbi:hypothetical protein RB200_29975 [Streptomyces sp. PmtG]
MRPSSRWRGLGGLAVTHRTRVYDGGLYVAAALLGMTGVGFLVGDIAAAGAFVLLVAAAVAVLGVRRHRRARRELPVLYGFQRGVILCAGDGRPHAYRWSEIDVEIRKTARDLPPWGTAEPDLLLRGPDGRLLASVRDPAVRQRLAALAAG